MNKALTVAEFEKSITELDKNIDALQRAVGERNKDFASEVQSMQSARTRLLKQFYAQLSTWNEVELARHKDRPYTLDYIKLMCDDFFELRGDRHIGDDASIVGGPARIGGRQVMLIGQQKGRDIKERMLRNFGYPKPEGYRKALRLMKMAEKLHMPVVTLIDTPGADANPGSEERAISEAIALNLWEMSILKTPIVSIVIGEGGSGGALGIAVADRVLMLEHSIYSVIAPEGCAAILETFGRNPERKPEAAEALKVSAKSAKELKLADEILSEPLGAAHSDPEAAAETLKKAILRNIKDLNKLPMDELLERRYQKYRSMGQFDIVEGAE